MLKRGRRFRWHRGSRAGLLGVAGLTLYRQSTAGRRAKTGLSWLSGSMLKSRDRQLSLEIIPELVFKQGKDGSSRLSTWETKIQDSMIRQGLSSKRIWKAPFSKVTEACGGVARAV